MASVPVGDSADEGGAERPRSQRRFPIARLGRIAAVILACVGVGTLSLEWFQQHQEEAAQHSASRTMWQMMADLHEMGVASTSCHQPLTAPVSDPAALAAEATKQLGYQVTVPKLGGDWKLDAASFASVDSSNGVRFHFTNGTHSATVISLPEAAWTYRTADTYATTVEGHAIAGFVKNAGLTCVVGDRSLPMADVQRLADELRTQ